MKRTTIRGLVGEALDKAGARDTEALQTYIKKTHKTSLTVRQIYDAKRSLENPSTPLDPDYVEGGWGSGPALPKGIKVNKDSLFSISAVWKAINLISSSVAKLPLYVLARIDAGKERARNHPAYYLLRRKPNPTLTAYTWKQVAMCQALSAGNGYGYIQRLEDGTPLEVWPLPADKVTPVRANGELWYVYSPDGAAQNKIPAADMIHLKGLGDSGLAGFSVIEKARQSFAVSMSMERTNLAFFKNNATPAFVLETPNTLTAAAVKNLRESWATLYQGIDKQHKPAILEQGLKLNPIQANAKDLQFIESREHSIREIANWFSISSSKLGDTAHTSFASLEQENLSFLNETLDPWLCAFEEEVWDKLLTEEEKRQDTHVIEFQRQALLRADMSARAAYYQSGLMNGYLSINEVRDMEGRNAIEGGDVYHLPLNIGELGIDNSTNGKENLQQ